jgi:hypothetical protein
MIIDAACAADPKSVATASLQRDNFSNTPAPFASLRVDCLTCDDPDIFSSLSAPIPVWHTGILHITPGAFIFISEQNAKMPQN